MAGLGVLELWWGNGEGNSWVMLLIGKIVKLPKKQIIK